MRSALKPKKVKREYDQHAGIKGDPKPERCLHWLLEQRKAEPRRRMVALVLVAIS